MRLGSPSLAPRHQYTPKSLNLVHVSSPVSFVSALPPRRLLHVGLRARHIVLRPTAAQRTAVAADEVPEPNEGFPSESLGNFRSSQPRKAVLKPAPTNFKKVLLALVQLSAVVALLILLPAWIACKCIPARAWQAAALYSVFFGFGGLRRTLKYGKLSSRKNDAQVLTGQGKRAIILFVLLVVAGKDHVSLNNKHTPAFDSTCRSAAWVLSTVVHSHSQKILLVLHAETKLCLQPCMHSMARA